MVFFGGEWHPLQLQGLLKLAQSQALTTCLYTGLNHVSRHLRPYLNFVKIGPWRADQGGLSNPYSNQKFYRLEDGKFIEDLTHLFQKESSIPFNQNNTLKDSYHAAA